MANCVYKLLFQVVCEHRYFSQQKAKMFRVEPTPACAQLLQRYQLIFRAFPGGAVVYYPCQNQIESTPAESLAQFNESMPFTFTLTSDDPNWLYYTDFGPALIDDPRETIYQFDNLADVSTQIVSTSNDNKKESAQLLHPLGQPLKKGALPVCPKRFVLGEVLSELTHLTHTPESEAPVSLKVQEKLTQHIVWQDNVLITALRKIPIDLSFAADGCYSLRLDGQPEQLFYLSQIPAMQQIGMIEIYIGGAAQQPYLPKACTILDENHRVQAKTFTLEFNNRHTIWRYYLINTSAYEKNYADYQLVALPREGEGQTPAQINFTCLPTLQSIEGRSAWVFESADLLPLWQIPAEKLSVLLRPDLSKLRSGRTITLPYPSANTLRSAGEALPQRVYSEVFVYL